MPPSDVKWVPVRWLVSGSHMNTHRRKHFGGHLLVSSGTLVLWSPLVERYDQYNRYLAVKGFVDTDLAVLLQV